MKKILEEFKKFVLRGNVIDMSVGVVIGGAFTAVVNGVTNNAIKPLVNAFIAWITTLCGLGKDGLSAAITPLMMEYQKNPETGEFLIDPETGERMWDLANSIYLDWGAIIMAIVNLLLTAIVLFIIVKAINYFRERSEKAQSELKKSKLTKEQKKELKALGIKRSNRQAVKAYLEKKAQEAAEAEAKAKAEAEEAARQDRLNNPTTEDLLKDIKALLASANAKSE